MDHVLDQCDLVVCHAGHGTVAAALLAGRPLLLIPDHVEQLLLSRKVVELGAAKMVNPDSRPSFGRLIGDILAHTEFTVAAREFARKYEHFSGVTPQRAIAARCEELMAAPAR
jgi:UDP:flavonoid glycosyltransferase YjiC (YdhE family)